MTCHSLRRPRARPFLLPLCSLTMKEICVYQVSTIILGKSLAAEDYCFMFNLISLRRVKNRSWSTSHFEDMEKRSCSPTLSAVMVQTLAGFIGALQAVIPSVKSAQICFIVNQSTETELVSGINSFLLRVP